MCEIYIYYSNNKSSYNSVHKVMASNTEQIVHLLPQLTVVFDGSEKSPLKLDDLKMKNSQMLRDYPASVCENEEKYTEFLTQMRLDHESKYNPLEKVERTACNDMLKESKLKMEVQEKSLAGIREGSVQYTLINNQLNRLKIDIEDLEKIIIQDDATLAEIQRGKATYHQPKAVLLNLTFEEQHQHALVELKKLLSPEIRTSISHFDTYARAWRQLTLVNTILNNRVFGGKYLWEQWTNIIPGDPLELQTKLGELRSNLNKRKDPDFPIAHITETEEFEKFKMVCSSDPTLAKIMEMERVDRISGTGLSLLTYDDFVIKMARYYAEHSTTTTHEILNKAKTSKVCYKCKQPGHDCTTCPKAYCKYCKKEAGHTSITCPVKANTWDHDEEVTKNMPKGRKNLPLKKPTATKKELIKMIAASDDDELLKKMLNLKEKKEDSDDDDSEYRNIVRQFHGEYVKKMEILPGQFFEDGETLEDIQANKKLRGEYVKKIEILPGQFFEDGETLEDMQANKELQLKTETIEKSLAGLKEGSVKIEKSLAGIKEGSVKYTLMYNQMEAIEKPLTELKEGSVKIEMYNLMEAIEKSLAGLKEGSVEIEKSLAGIKEGSVKYTLVYNQMEAIVAGLKEGSIKIEKPLAGIKECDMLKELQLKLETIGKSLAGLKEGSVKYALLDNHINDMLKGLQLKMEIIPAKHYLEIGYNGYKEGEYTYGPDLSGGLSAVKYNEDKNKNEDRNEIENEANIDKESGSGLSAGYNEGEEIYASDYYDLSGSSSAGKNNEDKRDEIEANINKDSVESGSGLSAGYNEGVENNEYAKEKVKMKIILELLYLLVTMKV